MVYLIASEPEHYRIASVLFSEYANSLDFELDFQNFSAELEAISVMYGPPDGTVILAKKGAEIAGCIAIRKIEETVGEVKRMYVRPAFRGQRIGKQLLEIALEKAVEMGYHKLFLDTVSDMQTAQHIYREYGFSETAPYCYNPLPNAVYMEKILDT